MSAGWPMLGLTNEHDPVKIERDLMAIIPKEDWLKTNYLLVEYGGATVRPNRTMMPLVR